MIQHLPPSRAALPPDAEMEESEHWRRSRMLMETVTNDELTDPTIAPERLLYRLFHEDGVRAFDPVPLRFGCRCSRERLARVLLKYPRETQEELVIDGRISANCEFCNETYHFTLDELGGQTPPNA